MAAAGRQVFEAAVILAFMFCACSLPLCQQGWITYSGNCYYVSGAAEDFSDAMTACAHKMAALVRIDDASEDSFLLANSVGVHSGREYWLGLRSVEYEDEEMTNFTWVDGTVLTYCNWAPGHPNPTLEYTNVCVRYSGMQWWSDGCDADLHYICEKPGYDVVSTSRQYRDCPDVESELSDTTYELPAESLSDCLLACLQVPGCISTGYDEDMGSCKLDMDVFSNSGYRGAELPCNAFQTYLDSDESSSSSSEGN